MTNELVYKFLKYLIVCGSRKFFCPLNNLDCDKTLYVCMCALDDENVTNDDSIPISTTTSPGGSNEVCCLSHISRRDGSRGGDLDDHPAKTFESNFFHHDFEQIRKTAFESHFAVQKAILPFIVSPQQCCEVYFMSLTGLNPSSNLTAIYH